VNHLDEIPVEELRDALDDVDGKKPTQRLLAAIAYKNSMTQTEWAEWYDVQRRTIYSRLTRPDTDESLEQAVLDDKRTGRKRKLSEQRQEEFEATVHEPPGEVGIDAPASRRASTRVVGRERGVTGFIDCCGTPMSSWKRSTGRDSRGEAASHGCCGHDSSSRHASGPLRQRCAIDSRPSCSVTCGS
jgi:transposase